MEKSNIPRCFDGGMYSASRRSADLKVKTVMVPSDLVAT